MLKLTITQTFAPKDVTTKYGVKQKASIKAQEKGDNYLSYWVTSSTQGWKVGDVVEVLDVTSREYNGKTYYDIVMPKTSGGVPAELTKSIEQILSDTTKIKLMVSQIVTYLMEGQKDKVEYPTAESEGIDHSIEPPF